MKTCKCEHWAVCPICQPEWFDNEGNRLPPEPTPLQAANKTIEELKQQLTELADKVREECAQVCEGVVCGSQGMAGPSRCILKPGHDGPHRYGVPIAKTQRECADAIRATKELPAIERILK